MLQRLSIVLCFLNLIFFIVAQDLNFHIYLCVGQSNMEGDAEIEDVDRENIPENFVAMAAVDFRDPEKHIGEWHEANPPLCRPDSKLGICDWFGRYMALNMGSDIKIGVIVVAVGGAKIHELSSGYELTEKDRDNRWWMDMMEQYDNYPYGRLLECARLAKQQGIIKAVIFHQGESNSWDTDYPQQVKNFYENLLNDLGLEASAVPLIAGQVVTTDMGGKYGAANDNINKLPIIIPTCYLVSAQNVPCQPEDPAHFSAEGYRVMGGRYAEKMLNIMGIQNPVISYQLPYDPIEYIFYNDNNIYSLQGKKITDCYQGTYLSPGIYIINNKKVYIKETPKVLLR